MTAVRLSLCAVLLLSSVCARAQQAPAADQPQAAAMPAPNDYSKAENWLCRPGRQDACSIDLSTTVLTADGKTTVETFKADRDALVDCFYVYPTVSLESPDNSDMTQEKEEKNVIRAQFARFAGVCRPYAPMYRQLTIASMVATASGRSTLNLKAEWALAYRDVQDAWSYYLEHDNHGRGVVLIGHSQGTGILRVMIESQIDGKPIQSQLVSALLLGTSLAVPAGSDVGGDFQHFPLCHAATQTGCVITYASFRATDPPPANTNFGKLSDPKLKSACTNPASLAGGSGALHAYFSVQGGMVWADEVSPQHWVKAGAQQPEPAIATPFVTLPGLLTASCVDDEHGSYLAIAIKAQPGDARTGEIPGDFVYDGKTHYEWGLHAIDIDVAQGNLIDIVSQQAKAWKAAH